MESENKITMTEDVLFRLIDAHWKEDTQNVEFGNEDTESMIKEFYVCGYKAAITDMKDITQGLEEIDSITNNGN